VSSLASPSYSYEPDDDVVVVGEMIKASGLSLVFLGALSGLSGLSASTAPELPELETSFRSISI